MKNLESLQKYLKANEITDRRTIQTLIEVHQHTVHEIVTSDETIATMTATYIATGKIHYNKNLLEVKVLRDRLVLAFEELNGFWLDNEDEIVEQFLEKDYPFRDDFNELNQAVRRWNREI